MGSVERANWLAAAAILGALLVAGRAEAGEIRFYASVDRNVVALDETLQLTLTVESEHPVSKTHIKEPDTGSLAIVGTSTSESMSFSFSGGTQSFKRLTNFVYTLKPTKLGKVRIGPAELTVGGKTYRTSPIEVRVVKSTGRRRVQRSPMSPLGPGFPSFDDDWDSFFSPFDRFHREEVGKDDIFVVLRVRPQQVYEGQQATASLHLYSRVGARVVSIRWPSLKDFFVVERDTSSEPTTQAVVGGVLYHTKVIDRRALFPMRAGEIEVGAVEVEVEVATSPFSPPTNMQLKTRPAKITVKPLPAEGRPDGFERPNVGSFTLSAAIDTTRARLNQPVTFRLILRGTGAIQRIRAPRLPRLDKFRMFDPEVKTKVRKKGILVRGSKEVETILVPLASGKLEIPPLEFSFFDPQRGQYRTLSTEKMQIEVSASGASGETGGMSAKEVNVVTGTFRPIRFEASLNRPGPMLVDRPAFWAGLFAAPAIYLLVLLGTAIYRMGPADSRRVFARKAWERSRRCLKNAAAAGSKGDAGKCFAELKEALLCAAEAKYGQPLQGKSLQEASRCLVEAGLDEQLVEKWRAEIENCDFGRFSPLDSRGQHMQKSLERTRAIVKQLERSRLSARSDR